MHVLRQIGLTNGAMDMTALVQVVPQALAQMPDMLSQERAPALRAAAIGFEHEVEADDRIAECLQLRLLGGGQVVARPDQEAQHERQKRRDEAKDRTEGTRFYHRKGGCSGCRPPHECDGRISSITGHRQ